MNYRNRVYRKKIYRLLLLEPSQPQLKLNSFNYRARLARAKLARARIKLELTHEPELFCSALDPIDK
jgi:hypothetical protein